MFTVNGTNQLLDATDISHVSSHTAYPGESGANEQSGGTPAYARAAVAFGAASGRTLTQSGTADLDIPAAADHAWFAFWDAATSGNCRAIVPAGGQAMEYSVDLSTDVFTTQAAHGIDEDDPIVFYMGAPGGLTAGVIYYAVNVTTLTFQVADAPGDYALDITSQPTQPAVVSEITVDPGSGGQRVVTLGPNATLHGAF
jgi:hypothetical protein